MMKKNSELVCGGNSEDSKLEKNLKNELSASDSDGSRPAGQTADCIKGANFITYTRALRVKLGVANL